MTFMAEAYRQLGDREHAAHMHEEALTIAREMGMNYFGGMILLHLVAETA
jgi:Tfp pilus assembly protein PilF